MNTYEAFATVEEQGEVRLAGIPFSPGTRVNVSVTPAQNGAPSASAGERDRALRLLASLDAARNSETVGPLSRTELYDRDIPH